MLLIVIVNPTSVHLVYMYNGHCDCSGCGDGDEVDHVYDHKVDDDDDQFSQCDPRTMMMNH